MEELLDSLLSVDKDQRLSAEHIVQARIVEHGHAVHLARIACDRLETIARRQLCLTLIKDVIRRRWAELESEQSSGLLEALLPLCIDPNKSIRSLSHACISLGASRVGVAGWNTLLLSIREGLLSTTVNFEVKVAICALLVSLLDECGGSAFVPITEGILRTLAETCRIFPSLARHCLNVWSNIARNMALDEEPVELNSFWMGIQNQLMKSDDIRDNISGITVLRELISVQQVEEDLKPIVAEVIAASITCLEKTERAFESLVVLSEEGGVDEDDEGGLSRLVFSICEVVNAAIISDVLCQSFDLERFVLAMKPYLQIPLAVEEEWLESPTEFIAHEQDDLYSSISIRLDFEGIVADALTNPILAHRCSVSVLRSAMELVTDGMTAAEGGNSEAWRRVEAGLFTLGLVSSEITVSIVDDRFKDILKLAASLAASDTSKPLLKARGLLCLSRLAEITSQIFADDLSIVLSCISQCLSDCSGIVVYAACRGLNAFLPYLKCGDETIARVALRLTEIASAASEGEIVHFTLESLIGIAKHKPHICVDSLYRTFIPEMLQKHVADPIAPTQLLEIIQNANCPYSLYEELAAVIKPWVKIEAETELDVALDFLSEIVKHASAPFTGNVLETILILNESKVTTLGENTNAHVDSILRVCAIRQPH